MAKESAELEKTGGSSLADVQKARPAYLKEREGQEARGLEEIGAQEMVLPRLTLTQNTTPQRNRQDPHYIPGLQEGQFFNSLTKEIYGDRVLVTPMFFRKSRIYFKDINQGGGIICRAPHGNDCQLNNGGPCLHGLWSNDGKPPECTEFYNYPSLLYPNNEIIVVSLKVTGIKAGKEWNTMMRLRGADPFAGIYEIKAVPARNKTGQNYYTYAVNNAKEEGGWVSKERFMQNEKMYQLLVEQFKSGQATVDESTLSEEQFAMRDAEEM